MDFNLILIGFVIIVALIALVFLGSRKGGNKEYPYVKQGELLSPAERSFYGVLLQAIENNAHIFSKVRVADIITPKKGINRSAWQVAFNKISAKHFDFVLCDKNDLSVLCVIELNDSSHNSRKRIERDSFLESACSASSLPLLQFVAKHSYNISEIREKLMPHINQDSKSYIVIEKKVVEENIKSDVEVSFEEASGVTSNVNEDLTEEVKLTTSKLAQKLKLSTVELLDALVKCNILEIRDDKHYLTDKGIQEGGELREGRHGSYFLWPKTMTL